MFYVMQGLALLRQFVTIAKILPKFCIECVLWKKRTLNAFELFVE